MKKRTKRKLTKHHQAFVGWGLSNGYSEAYILQASSILASDSYSQEQHTRCNGLWFRFVSENPAFSSSDRTDRYLPDTKETLEPMCIITSRAERKMFRAWVISKGYAESYSRQMSMALEDVTKTNNPRAARLWKMYSSERGASKPTSIAMKVMACDLDPETKNYLLRLIQKGNQP